VSRSTVGERRAASLELYYDLPARAGTAATWSKGDLVHKWWEGTHESTARRDEAPVRPAGGVQEQLATQVGCLRAGAHAELRDDRMSLWVRAARAAAFVVGIHAAGQRRLAEASGAEGVRALPGGAARIRCEEEQLIRAQWAAALIVEPEAPSHW
jgi:hypothetical protein